MKRHFKAILTGLFLSLAWIAAACAQSNPSYQYLNITGTGTALARTGNGILHTVCFNNPIGSSTITIYDGTSAAGTKIGTITLPATGFLPQCLLYDVAYGIGLTLVTGSATSSDITVSYR